MIVQCENCETKFKVNPDRIKDEGSKVRCSSCKHVFKIYRPGFEPNPIPSEEPGPKTSSDPESISPGSGGDTGFESPGEDRKDEPFPEEKPPADDLDDDLDFGGPEESIGSADGFDFGDLDDDSAMGTSTDQGVASLSEDDLTGDLGGDFDFGDLELGPPTDMGDASPGGDDLTGDLGGDFDFGDLDGDLELGPPADTGDASPAGNDLGDDDLGSDFDFGDIGGDLELGPPADTGDTSPGGDDLGDDGLGGDFDFGDIGGDLADAGEAPPAGDGLGGDFDFGDLDGDLELGEPSEAGVSGDASEFDLNLSDSGDQTDDNLDFGDLDGLDIGGSPSAEEKVDLGTPPTSDDDDLDFGSLGDDFDLGEPDTLIEDQNPMSDESDGGLDDMKLGAGGDDFAGFAGEEIPDDDDNLDFGDQFTDLGPEVDITSPVEQEPGGDFDFDQPNGADLDDINPLDELVPDGNGEDLVFYGDEGEPEAVAGRVEASPKKRKFQWILVGLFGFLALVAAVFFLAPDILSPILEPLGITSGGYDSAKDPDGNQFLSVDKTTHYFGTNKYLGNILVISGLVVNHYPKPRSHIRIKAMLQSKEGDKLLGVKQVYGGNWLSGDELQSLPFNEIIKRLRVESGQNDANVNVQPDASVKYMIVFDQVPDSLGSYTVEALGSEPAAE